MGEHSCHAGRVEAQDLGSSASHSPSSVLCSESLAHGCPSPQQSTQLSEDRAVSSPHLLTLFGKNTQGFANSPGPMTSVYSRETPAKDQDHPALGICLLVLFIASWGQDESWDLTSQPLQDPPSLAYAHRDVCSW